MKKTSTPDVFSFIFKMCGLIMLFVATPAVVFCGGPVERVVRPPSATSENNLPIKACLIKVDTLCDSHEIRLSAYYWDKPYPPVDIKVFWSNGISATSIIVDQQGVYSYSAPPGFHCEPGWSQMQVEINPNFYKGAVDLSSTYSTICPGLPIEIDVITDPYSPSLSYKWNPQPVSGPDPATFIGPGTFSVTVTDQMGCKKSKKVAVAPHPPIQKKPRLRSKPNRHPNSTFPFHQLVWVILL